MKTLRWLLLAWLSVTAVFAAFKTGDKVEILWSGHWYPGAVLEVNAEKTKIHYDGYGSNWDEWVTAERVRAVGVASAANPASTSAVTSGNVADSTTTTGAPASIHAATSSVATTSNATPPSGSSAAATSILSSVPAANPEPAAAAPPAPTKPAAPLFDWPTRPSDTKAGLEGAWLRVETYYWSGRLSINSYGWFFTKDGRVSRAPVGGFNFDKFKQAPKAHREDGVYWISGDKINLRWADGSKDWIYTFERKGDEIALDGIGGTPVKPFKRGLRFEGPYEGGASVGGGAVASSTTITFRKDGTYSRESIGSIRSGSGSDQVEVSAYSQLATAGTYEFNGYTLTLSPHAGPTESSTVFAFGDTDATGRPEYINRDGTMMHRQ